MNELAMHLAKFNPSICQAEGSVTFLERKNQQLGEENEALKDRLQAADLWDVTSKLKISDLEEEIGALKHEILQLKSAGAIQAREKKSMEELIAELAGEKAKLRERVFYLEMDEAYQTKELIAMREEIRRLRREKDLAVEKVFELGADFRRKDEVIVALAGKNQQFFDKILGTSLRLDTLVQATINYWMQERLAERLISQQKKPKDVPLGDVKKLLDSVREKIAEIEAELMAGVNLSNNNYK